MKLIPDRIRKLNKSPKEKRVYTAEEIHHRDKLGLRARDYFITVLVSLVVFVILYYYYHWDINKTLLTVLFVAIVLLLLLRKIVEAPEEEEEIEGYLITWVDPIGFYHIPAHHNMKILYGKARKLPDGSLESIKESFLMTYETKKVMQRRFNRMLSCDIAYVKKLRDEGETVYFCDGTDKFQNPIQAMVNKTSVLKSAGLTGRNVQHMTDWMKQRGTVVEE